MDSARSVRVGSLLRRVHGEDSMKKSRFTEEQAAYALRQTEAGAPVTETCESVWWSMRPAACW